MFTTSECENLGCCNVTSVGEPVISLQLNSLRTVEAVTFGAAAVEASDFLAMPAAF